MESRVELPVEQEEAAPQAIPRQGAARSAGMRGLVVALVLGAILILGFYLRVVGHDWGSAEGQASLSTRLTHWITWDENRHLHPDERFLTMVENSLTLPQSVGEYFDTARSPLNPHNKGHGFFVYGTLPIFLVRIIGEAVNMVDYDGVTVLGRLLSALADLGAVVVLFVIARRLYDWRVGLLTAAFSALAVMQIQQSHFFTVDTFANFFVVLAFYFAVRVAQGGGWGDYLALGLFLGAGVASKISVWSFGVVAALAGWIALSHARSAPAGGQDRSPASEGLPASPSLAGRKGGELGRVALGLVLAAVVSLIAFRVFQPYAFQGPGFVSLKLNPAWLSNMNEVQRLVNGEADYPPGHQWTDRIPYWFPWINMVVWGLGLPLGLAAWAGWLAALLRSVRTRWRGWALVLGYGAILVFTTWAAPVFGGRSSLISLALAGVWILVWLLWAGGEWRQHLLPVAWIAITFAYQGGQFVKSLRYLLQIYPFLALMAAWLLVWVWDTLTARRSNAERSTRSSWAGRIVAGGFIVLILAGSLAWAWAFTRIYTRPVTRIAATRWIYANVPAGATVHYQTADGQQRQVQIGLPNKFTWNQDGELNVTGFEMREPGQITGVSLNNLTDPMQRSTPVTFEALISPDSIPENAVAKGQASAVLGDAPAPSGKRLDIPLGPVPVEAGRRYSLITRPVAGAPVQSSGSVLANEHWDDPIPMPMDGYDGFGMYRGIDLENYAEDEPSKLDKMVQWLVDTEYIMLTSNRLYGSIPRLPMRYPMTTRFYQLLFSEELGFKRIADFESYPNLGPLTFPDQETAADALHAAGIRDTSSLVGEPASGWFPRAEEAFSVYDHPRVIIFQKAETLSADQIRTLLSREIEWDQIRRLWPRDATKETWKARWQQVPLIGGLLAGFIGRSESGGQPPPVAAEKEDTNRLLLLTDAQSRIQRAGGTWSQMFNPQSPINTHPLLGLIAWLLVVELLGLLAFPLAFVVFRNLSDRGYTFAKTLGLLLVSYGAWLAGSLGWLPYTRVTLVLMMLLMAVVSVIVARGARHALVEFVRTRGRLLLLVDGLFLALFLGFLVIRLGYPDLWHPAMGGEKPMDFAYLNAVMKSTHFPPYDPWFAGGYLNYYYYGFVLVGSLIKLVGVASHIAYNFTIPLLFALTGLGAFGVVYNLTAWLVESRKPKVEDKPATRTSRLLTPVFFGLMGALFVAVIGNFGELSLILGGLSQLSGLEFRSTIPGLEAVAKSLTGLSRIVFDGQSLPFRIEWWYWNPTRIMPNGEIEEFPFFTFLYADLHAHMIALPLTLMALGLAVNLVRRAERRVLDILSERVGPAAVIASWLVYALTLGALWPTNTWDYPTYLVVILGALLIREYQQRGRLNLRALWEVGWRFALLAVLSFLLFFPYAQHYRTAYTSAELWQGPRTSLSDYLTIHGFFLFILVTFLVTRLSEWLAGSRQAVAQAPDLQPLPAEASQLLQVAPNPGPLPEGEAIAASSLSEGEPAAEISLEQADEIAESSSPDGEESLESVEVVPPSPPVELVEEGGRAGLLTLVWLIAGFGLLLAALVLLRQPIAALVLTLGGLSLLLILRRSLPGSARGGPRTGEAEESLVLFLIGSALALTLAVEFLVLKGDIGRMNTVFKFYLQVWVMLAVASAAALAWILRWLRDADQGVRRVWLGAFGVLLACCLLYPIFATRARLEDRFVRLPPTVDGMAYMEKAVYHDQGSELELRYDRDAINWMREHVTGSPVILEGNAPEYRWGSRFSIYTGLPAVIGWNWHQRQQRSIYTEPVVENRIADVARAYSSPDPDEALQILQNYGVKYVIVGELERAYYDPAGLAKFDQMVGQTLDLVYENPKVKIYQVRSPA